jgi:predicted permease
VKSITSIVRELRLAVRRLIREPGFSFTAVATVAVGIGIAASVFALVEGVLIRPLPYPDSGRLVSVSHAASGIELTRDRVSAGIFLHYRDRNRVFDGLGGYEQMSYTFTDAGGAERIRTATVTPELFSVLQMVPRLGRLPTVSDHNLDYSTNTGTTGAVLSHELWVRRYNADPGVIGRTIEIDGNPFAAVIGVAPEGFSFPDPATQAWLVQPQEKLSWSGRAEVRQAMFLNVVARLRPGVTLADAEADLNRLVHLLPEAFPDITAEDLGNLGLRAQLKPLKDEIVGEVRLTLLLVLASGGFLLLITWANVANLMLTRTHGRRVEFGIARALGATELNVARRLLSESILITMSGGLLGLGLAYLATEARFSFAPNQLPRLDEVGINSAVIGLVLALAVISGALMGAICLASTRQGAAGPAMEALRSRSATQGPEGQTGRRILVASQMALALTLLVGCGLMARTFWRLQQADLGFRPEGRLTFYLPVTHLGLRADHEEIARLHDQVLRRLRAVPGVDAVEAASTSVFPLILPEGGHDPATVAPTGAAKSGKENWPLAYYGTATPGYFQAMGIPLVAGRPFRSEDTSPEAPGMIISESLARDLFAGEEPIGRSVEFVDFRSFWVSHAVVGVVGDIPGTTMREGGSRTIYLPHVYPLAANVSTTTLHPYLPMRETYVVRTGRDLASLVPELRRGVYEVDPRLPMMGVATLDEIVTEATAQERFTMRLLLLSAGAALFLGVVGIYGVLAYSVRRRTAEIGIRIALGASPRRVTRHIVFQGAVLSAAGIAAGIVAALLMTRFIASLLYETSPTDPVTFAAVTSLLLGVALAASYVPARRASRIDPAQALRAD